MAGKTCPDCGQLTFHKTPTGRKCSKCGYEMKVPPNNGKGGKGMECANCGEHKVRDDATSPGSKRCNGCGATYSPSKA